MGTYLVMLLVRTEQEEAIRFLFEQRGWRYVKTGTRVPVAEELEFLYNTLLPKTSLETSFKSTHPYLPLGYTDPSTQFPSTTNFSRAPALSYSAHALNKDLGYMCSAGGGVGSFVGSLDLPVTSGLAPVSCSEMPPSAIDSVGCISKTLTILENVGTAQFRESVVLEQTSTHTLPLVSDSVSGRCMMTPQSLETAQPGAWQNAAMPNQAKGVITSVFSVDAGKEALPTSSENTDVMRTESPGPLPNQAITASIENIDVMKTPGHSAAPCISNISVKCITDSNRNSNAGMVDTTTTDQGSHASSKFGDVETNTCMMLLSSIRQRVKQELQNMDIADDSGVDIDEIQNEVANLIIAKLEKRVWNRDLENDTNEKSVGRISVNDDSDEHIIGQESDSDISKDVMNVQNRSGNHKQLYTSKKTYSSINSLKLVSKSRKAKNEKDNYKRIRKHHWSVNRNIRMHGYHRKCTEIPADVDVNSYSVAEKGFFCSDCFFVFNTVKQLRLHKDLKGGQCSSECLYCDKDNLKDIYQCDRCPKCFKTQELLDKHMERHTCHYTCEFCEASFYTAAQLKLHVQSSHAEVSKVLYLCDLCGASFSERKVLNGHRKYVHTDERPEVCLTCGSKFKTKSQLKNHLITHKKLEEVNLSCEICGKMFMRMASLKDHVRRHKNEHSVFCSLCGKGFYRKSGLAEHMRTHTGLKPFECSICLYKCALKCNLVKHMKVHSQKTM